METKIGHTPGPWKPHVYRWPNGKLNGTPSVYAPNGNDGGRHVCELCDNGQLDENAKLIAAAPELLDALVTLVANDGQGMAAMDKALRVLVKLNAVPSYP